MSSSAFDHEIGLAGQRNMSHVSLASNEDNFDGRPHRMQSNQPGSINMAGDSYPSASTKSPMVDEHFSAKDSQSQHKSQMPMLFPIQQNSHQVGTIQNSMPGSAFPPQQQHQQIFYMAVATADGRQVLQPVQVVQIPGQSQPAVVLASSMPGVTLNTGTMSQQSQAMPPQAMMASAGGHVDVPSPPNSKKYDPRRSKAHQQGGAQRIGSNLSSSGKQNLPYGQRGRLDDPDFIYESSYENNRSYARDGSSSGAHSFSNDQMSYSRRPTPSNSRGPSPRASPTPNDVIATLYAAPQRPPLDELLGNVRRLSRDQVGCRLLQQALDEEGPMAATMILEEGLSFWGEAMVDPFGNYLFQKILEKITPSERVILVRSVSARLVNASLNLHGTRSVQKVVELCASDEPIMVAKNKEQPSSETVEATETSASILTRSLTPAAARLCIDSHGNHVIQRILLKLPQQHSHFVFEAVAASVGDVARHRHGCCVIQRCLDSPPSDARSHLVDRIVEKALELMQDAYGNYVIQYVLDVCGDNDVHVVCESVVGRVNSLAIQKFSSNVVEKCLERCTDEVREQYLDELSDSDRIRELMMDPFGNYVIQRALSVATHAQATRLVDAIRPHLLPSQHGGQSCAGLRNTAGGRRILAKICRRFPNFHLDPVGDTTSMPQQMYHVPQNKHIYARGGSHPHHMNSPMQINPNNMGLSPAKRRSFQGNAYAGSYRGGNGIPVDLPDGYHSSYHHQPHNVQREDL